MTLVWDWNGTLLDDTQAAVAAFNDQLVQRGLPPITLDFYREHFAFPVRPFYALCGVDLAHEDWDAIAQGYHDAYHAHPSGLNAEAIPALTLAREAGCRQVIVSALRQDYLDAAVDRFGIRAFFDAVLGTDNLDGASKLARAKSYFNPSGSAGTPRPTMLCAHLQPKHPNTSSLLCIGDSLHDKELADALGARCILFGGGSHAPHRLAAVAPVAGSLTEAVKKALVF